MCPSVCHLVRACVRACIHTVCVCVWMHTTENNRKLKRTNQREGKRQDERDVKNGENCTEGETREKIPEKRVRWDGGRQRGKREKERKEEGKGREIITRPTNPTLVLCHPRYYIMDSQTFLPPSNPFISTSKQNYTMNLLPHDA